MALAGAVGAGFSLLVGVAGMLSAVKSAPLLASLGPLAGLLLMPIFYLVAALVSLPAATVAGALFFVADASSILNRVPTPLIPLICAAFGYVGVYVAAGVFDSLSFNSNSKVLSSLFGFASGAALLWLPALRPLSAHLRKTQRPL